MTTWLITGSNSGLGRALALELLERGHNVVATARDVSSVQDLADSIPDRVLALPFDVTDMGRAAAVVAEAETRFGAVDVLVNNAGYGYRSAVEEGEVDAVNRLFDTHFFGAVAAIKAVLPGMRARRTGAVVNLSSIAVRVTSAGSGYYAGAKGALEGMSGSLAKELKPLGIDVMVVEPGGFRTDFAGRSLTQSVTVIPDYAETAGKRRKENDTSDGTQPGDPAKGARAIVDAVEGDDTPEMLVIGRIAVQSFRDTLDGQLASLEAWRTVGEETDFPA